MAKPHSITDRPVSIRPMPEPLEHCLALEYDYKSGEFLGGRMMLEIFAQQLANLTGKPCTGLFNSKTGAPAVIVRWADLSDTKAEAPTKADPEAILPVLHEAGITCRVDNTPFSVWAESTNVKTLESSWKMPATERVVS